MLSVPILISAATPVPTQLPAWPQYQQNQERQGYAANSGFSLPLAAPFGDVTYSETLDLEPGLDAASIAGPIVWENLAYVGTASGRVHGVDLTKGGVPAAKLWTRRLDGPVLSCPAARNGWVLASTGAGTAWVLDALTGAVRFKWKLHGNTQGPLALAQRSDGRWVASWLTADGRYQAWDLGASVAGQAAVRLAEFQVQAPAYSPGGLSSWFGGNSLELAGGDLLGRVSKAFLAWGSPSSAAKVHEEDKAVVCTSLATGDRVFVAFDNGVLRSYSLQGLPLHAYDPGQPARWKGLAWDASREQLFAVAQDFSTSWVRSFDKDLNLLRYLDYQGFFFTAPAIQGDKAFAVHEQGGARLFQWDWPSLPAQSPGSETVHHFGFGTDEAGLALANGQAVAALSPARLAWLHQDPVEGDVNGLRATRLPDESPAPGELGWILIEWPAATGVGPITYLLQRSLPTAANPDPVPVTLYDGEALSFLEKFPVLAQQGAVYELTAYDAYGIPTFIQPFTIIIGAGGIPATRTISPTFSHTRTATQSATFTLSPTLTATDTATASPSPLATGTLTSTPSPFFSPTETHSPSPTRSPALGTITPTPTDAPTRRDTLTPSHTRTATISATRTPSPVATRTATITRTDSPSPTRTLSRTMTLSATPTPTQSPSPTATRTRTPTLVGTPPPCPVTDVTFANPNPFARKWLINNNPGLNNTFLTDVAMPVGIDGPYQFNVGLSASTVVYEVTFYFQFLQRPGSPLLVQDTGSLSVDVFNGSTGQFENKLLKANGPDQSGFVPGQPNWQFHRYFIPGLQSSNYRLILNIGPNRGVQSFSEVQIRGCFNGPTPSRTPTNSRTISPSPTRSRTRTVTRTASPSPPYTRTATRTASPSPSITLTRTVTLTPTPGVLVYADCGVTANCLAQAPILHPWLRVQASPGGGPVDLSTLRLRYWIQVSDPAALQLAGPANDPSFLDALGQAMAGLFSRGQVQLSLVTVDRNSYLGAQNRYVDIRFNVPVGTLLQPGQSFDLDFTLRRPAASAVPFEQSNDWSWDNVEGLQVWERVTAYRVNTLIWGREPSLAQSTATATPLATMTATPSVTLTVTATRTPTAIGLCFVEDWSSYPDGTIADAKPPYWRSLIFDRGQVLRQLPTKQMHPAWGVPAMISNLDYWMVYDGHSFSRPLTFKVRLDNGADGSHTIRLLSHGENFGYSYDIGLSTSENSEAGYAVSIFKNAEGAIVAESGWISARGVANGLDDILEVTIDATKVSAAVNGVPLVSLEDSEYSSGSLVIIGSSLSDGQIAIGPMEMYSSVCVVGTPTMTPVSGMSIAAISKEPFNEAHHMEGLLTDRDLIVVPNPAKAQADVFYRLDKNAKARLLLMDLTGSVVWQSDLGEKPQGVHRQRLDLSSKANGLYILALALDQGQGWKVQQKFKVAVAR